MKDKNWIGYWITVVLFFTCWIATIVMLASTNGCQVGEPRCIYLVD